MSPSFVVCVLTIVLLLLATTDAQFFYHSPSIQQQHYQIAPIATAAPPNDYSHPSVVSNSAIESQLPPELLKSDRFYKHPSIAAALAKESWFTDKEMPVFEREAEKIPRDMIFKLFRNAGWIKRR